MSGTVTGAEAAIRVLRDAGVRAVFGNPGTTELPLMRALAGCPEIAYYLSLHEDVCTGMAAGYAAVTGALGVAMLHAVPGVAHGLANYYNAFRNRLPLLLLSGQQDLRHQFLAPMLYGDLERMMAPFSKFSWETRTAEELPAVMRRAVLDALTAPTGPAFVSIPLDVQLRPLPQGSAAPRVAPAPLGPASPDAIRDVAARFARARRPAIVAGDVIGRARCEVRLAQLAFATASAAYWEPMSLYANVPKDHPCFAGVLFPSGADFRRVAETHDFILWCGADLRAPLLYDGIRWDGDGADIAVLADGPARTGDGFGATVDLVGDPALTLAALVAEVESLARRDGDEAARAVEVRRGSLAAASQAARAKVTASAARRAAQVPLAPASVVQALLAAAPPNAIVVDEAVSNSGWVSLTGEYRDAIAYLGPSKGGGIGFGLPVAMGAQLGAPERPVIALLGDGSALYAIQGLWTAAHHRIPVVFVILNNASYRILKGGLTTMFGADEAAVVSAMPGFDLGDPEPNFVQCAHGFGIDAVRVTSLDGCGEALAAALASGKPWLIDVAVERDVRPVLR